MKQFFLLLSLFLGALFPLSASSPSPDENAILCPENGLEMFRWDLEFVSHANKSIEIMASFLGGEVAQELLDALDKRLCEVADLQVYLMASPVIMEDRNHHQIEELLVKHPGRFHFETSPDIPILFPKYSTTLCHVKCFIVDERYFSMGGTSLDSILCADGSFTPPRGEREGIMRENLPAAARDQDIVGRGPLAKKLRHLIHNLFAQWEDYLEVSHEFVVDPESFATKNHYFPIAEIDKAFVPRFENEKSLTLVSDLQFIASGPMDSANPNTLQYARLIREAKKEIFIANLHFNPVSAIMKALKEASNRGVKITVITNGIRDSSPGYNTFYFWANRINYLPLFLGRDYHYWEYWQANKDHSNAIKIYEYDVADIVYHKKVMVVDHQITIIGSYNLGTKSDENDYEITATMNSPKIAERVLKILEKDRSLSAEITLDDAMSWYFDPCTNYFGTLQKQYHNLL